MIHGLVFVKNVNFPLFQLQTMKKLVCGGQGKKKLIMISFKSDPNLYKDLSKKEIWEDLKQDLVLTKVIKQIKDCGMSLETPRKYRFDDKD